ncbi:undecaprenyl-diphosphate phosphatase [Patescibacteria group bacterium]
MIEGLVLGIVQGITEWLPISSSGVLTLVGLTFFGHDLGTSVSMALFLHVGTFLSALVYFWKEVVFILKGGDKKVFNFLLISTIVTGVVGIPVAMLIYRSFSGLTAGVAVALIGFFLIITGLLQLKKTEDNLRTKKDLTKNDALVGGILQGFSVLPGLSRSGLTVAGLLFRKIKDTDALKLSFLMSLPVVLGGNIILNFLDDGIELSSVSFVALFTAFIVGLLTIKTLLKISRKINFGYFAIGFGVLTLLSLFFI